MGRTLTVARARQLNSRTYFYEMLKDNPRLTAIRPGVEDEFLEGAIDHHIHAFPDFVPRSQDMLQIAVDASRAKMRAVAFKDHWNLTAGAAYLVQKQIDEMVLDGRLTHRVEVYGGLGLNLGVNPQAVRVALKYPNFKCIWFPTFRSYGWARSANLDPDPDEYIRLVAPSGEVLPEVREVMSIAAEAGVAIGLGHTDYEELLPLCTLANELGVRTVLDHPLLELNKLLLTEMATLADLGTYVGVYCQPMIPSLYQPVQDPMETVEVIRRIGPARCVSGSDFGQVLHLDSVAGMRVFVRALLGFGVEPADVKTILCDTPARLLGLDPEPAHP
ncbi:MAG TPA: DUF6282 family protein [Natronosporangium sp.]|nr:DUF6282 family protein [Natronosporangium sp.]